MGVLLYLDCNIKIDTRAKVYDFYNMQNIKNILLNSLIRFKLEEVQYVEVGRVKEIKEIYKESFSFISGTEETNTTQLTVKISAEFEDDFYNIIRKYGYSFVDNTTLRCSINEFGSKMEIELLDDKIDNDILSSIISNLKRIYSNHNAIDSDDKKFIEIARYAAKASDSDNPIGCVVVNKNKSDIIVLGCNCLCMKNLDKDIDDPNVLNACRFGAVEDALYKFDSYFHNFNIKDVVIYVTEYPGINSAKVIVRFGIKKLIYDKENSSQHYILQPAVEKLLHLGGVEVIKYKE